MSLISQIKTNFRLGFSRTRKQRSDLDELKAVVASLQQQLGQLQGGSSHHAGLSLDPPLVWLLITQIGTGALAGRRLNVVPWNSLPYPPENPGDPAGPAPGYEEFGDLSVFVIDKDDEQPYLIETDGTMPLVFVGARVLCINTRLYDQGDEPAKALYRPIAGEVFGFTVRLFDPDENNRYPWEQVGQMTPLSDGLPRFYTNETVPVEGGPMLGLAEPFERHAYDTQITVRHRNYANTNVFLQFRSVAGFLSFNGFEEPQHDPCAAVVSA